MAILAPPMTQLPNLNQNFRENIVQQFYFACPIFGLKRVGNIGSILRGINPASLAPWKSRVAPETTERAIFPGSEGHLLLVTPYDWSSGGGTNPRQDSSFSPKSGAPQLLGRSGRRDRKGRGAEEGGGWSIPVDSRDSGLQAPSFLFGEWRRNPLN